MDLVLFGMQGSGKGTQAKIIAKQCGFSIFEAGAELRRLASEDSELGQKVKSIIESGKLVPTEVVMEIIDDFVSKLEAGSKVLFDGIPRSEDQREQFVEIMKKNDRKFKGLLIELSEEEALKRLTTRRLCPVCKTNYPAFYESDVCENDGSPLETRRDDTPDAIRVRLDTFVEKTQPVIEQIKASGDMLVVNGQQSIEDVTSDIMEVLKDIVECH